MRVCRNSEPTTAIPMLVAKMAKLTGTLQPSCWTKTMRDGDIVDRTSVSDERVVQVGVDVVSSIPFRELYMNLTLIRFTVQLFFSRHALCVGTIARDDSDEFQSQISPAAGDYSINRTEAGQMQRRLSSGGLAT